MLVLTRKSGASIHIGDDIIVKILDFNIYNQVRVGIIAPDGVAVWREEIYAKIKKEQEELLCQAK